MLSDHRSMDALLNPVLACKVAAGWFSRLSFTNSPKTKGEKENNSGQMQVKTAILHGYATSCIFGSHVEIGTVLGLQI